MIRKITIIVLTTLNVLSIFFTCMVMFSYSIELHIRNYEKNVFTLLTLIILIAMHQMLSNITKTKNKNRVNILTILTIITLTLILLFFSILMLSIGRLIGEHLNEVSSIINEINITKKWNNEEKINEINKYILANPKIEIVFPNTLDCLKTHVHELELIQHLNVLKVLAKQAEKYDTRVLEIQNVPVEDLSDMNIPILLVCSIIALISYKIVSNCLNNNK